MTVKPESVQSSFQPHLSNRSASRILKTLQPNTFLKQHKSKNKKNQNMKFPLLKSFAVFRNNPKRPRHRLTSFVFFQISISLLFSRFQLSTCNSRAPTTTVAAATEATTAAVSSNSDNFKSESEIEKEFRGQEILKINPAPVYPGPGLGSGSGSGSGSGRVTHSARFSFGTSALSAPKSNLNQSKRNNNNNNNTKRRNLGREAEPKMNKFGHRQLNSNSLSYHFNPYEKVEGNEDLFPAQVISPEPKPKAAMLTVFGSGSGPTYSAQSGDAQEQHQSHSNNYVNYIQANDVVELQNLNQGETAAYRYRYQLLPAPVTVPYPVTSVHTKTETGSYYPNNLYPYNNHLQTASQDLRGRLHPTHSAPFRIEQNGNYNPNLNAPQNKEKPGGFGQTHNLRPSLENLPNFDDLNLHILNPVLEILGLAGLKLKGTTLSFIKFGLFSIGIILPALILVLVPLTALIVILVLSIPVPTWTVGRGQQHLFRFLPDSQNSQNSTNYFNSLAALKHVFFRVDDGNECIENMSCKLASFVKSSKLNKNTEEILLKMGEDRVHRVQANNKSGNSSTFLKTLSDKISRGYEFQNQNRGKSKSSSFCDAQFKCNLVKVKGIPQVFTT